MEVHDVGEQYRARTDEELLRLALEPEQLAPEAQIQLHAELARRGIDSPARLEEFRAEEGRKPPEPREYTGRSSGIVATLRDWQRYRRQTGEWPVASVIASVVQGVVLLTAALSIMLFGVRHDWSKTKFLLVVASVLIPELCLWDRIQKKIRLKELRGYRSRRTLAAAGPK
jgi:hypothetical protein